MTIDEIAGEIDEIAAKTIQVVANSAGFDMTTRIFELHKGVDGREFGSVSFSGERLGAYSKQYAEYRQSLPGTGKRQIATKDLQLFGSLIRSIEQVVTDNGEAIIINNEEDFIKAQKQELQLRMKIFEVNQSELDDAFEKGNEYFLQRFVDLFSTVKIEL